MRVEEAQSFETYIMTTYICITFLMYLFSEKKFPRSFLMSNRGERKNYSADYKLCPTKLWFHVKELLALNIMSEKCISLNYIPTTSISPDTINVWKDGKSAEISHEYLPDVTGITFVSVNWLSLDADSWERDEISIWIFSQPLIRY